MGFQTRAINPTVLKTSIGTKVGTWSATVEGEREDYLPVAGAVRRLLGFWEFGSRITGWLTVSMAGEGYEDFRRKVGIPFFTTATASIEGDTRVEVDYKTGDLQKEMSLSRKPHTYSAEHDQAVERMDQEVDNAVKRLLARMRASSFSRECGYCKSMFVGEGSCPYCGAPAGAAGGSIVDDRAPSPPTD